MKRTNIPNQLQHGAEAPQLEAPAEEIGRSREEILGDLAIHRPVWLQSNAKADRAAGLNNQLNKEHDDNTKVLDALLGELFAANIVVELSEPDYNEQQAQRN